MLKIDPSSCCFSATRHLDIPIELFGISILRPLGKIVYLRGYDEAILWPQSNLVGAVVEFPARPKLALSSHRSS